MGGKITGGLNPFDASIESNDDARKRNASHSISKDAAQSSYLENKSGLKQKLVKRARISLIDNRDQNGNTYSPLKDAIGQGLKGASANKKLKNKGLKFPIHEFISASSDQEEDLIIEKYSQVLRSQEKIFEKDKKNRDSVISAKGSKNFRAADESKNVLSGVAAKVELRNQVPNIQNVKQQLRSSRDNYKADELLGENRRESLPQITEK